MAESKTLPVLVKEAGDIAHLLAESGGEITPEIEALIDRSNQQLTEKCDAYGMVITSLEAHLVSAEARMEEWQAYVKSLRKSVESMKDRMLLGMQMLDIVEINGNEVGFRVQANPPKAEIEDQSKLPGDYLITRTETSVDKKKVLDDLKAGKAIPGARLERGVRLIKKVAAKALNKAGA